METFGNDRTKVGGSVMKKLRVGMIGGGSGFFGDVHRRAINLDGTREIVAGALRSNPEESIKTAKELGINGYTDYKALLDASEKEKLDYVVIITPNNAHFAPAKAFIEKGIPVFVRKTNDFNS